MAARSQLDSPPRLSTEQILLEQYRILEERRMFFGRQFMQTAGSVGALFTLAVSLLGEGNPALLKAAGAVGGVAFILMAVLGYRLGERQDDCEDGLAEIEGKLRACGYESIVGLRRGATFGARKLIVGAFAVAGVALLGLSAASLWY